LHERFRASIDVVPARLGTLARSALEKLDSYAGILGIDPGTSSWCAAARACLEAAQRSAEPQAAGGALAGRS
jgi:hypothetical protein